MNKPATKTDGQRLLLGALLAVTFLLGCFPMGDFDVWWHLRSGQLIWERGTVPRTDWFTYTNAERPWVDLYWLFQIFLAGLYRLGGASALVLLKALAGVAIVWLTVLARGPGARAWPVALAWLPAVVALSGRLCERPELASLLFLAGFLTVLARGAERPRLLWLLPAMQALWVNCHGFFVLGPLVLAAYWADLLYGRLRPEVAAGARPPIKALGIATGASLLACLVSPYGFRATSLPLEQFGKLGSTGVYRNAIGELKTVGDFIAQAGAWNPYLLAYLVVLGLGIASFAYAGRRARVRPFRVLLFLAGAYLGWQATRNAALFAVLAAFVTIWNFDEGATATPAKDPRRSRKAPPPKAGRHPNHVLLAAIAALGIAVLSGGLYRWAGEGRTIGMGERRDWYAHGACAFLAGPDRPERIVAYNLGQAGVCIAHTAPAHKQFMDPRLEVSTQETFERYLAGIRKLWRGEPDWEAAPRHRPRAARASAGAAHRARLSRPRGGEPGARSALAARVPRHGGHRLRQRGVRRGARPGFAVDLPRAAETEELRARRRHQAKAVGGALGARIATAPTATAQDALVLAGAAVVAGVGGGGPFPDVAGEVEGAVLGRPGREATRGRGLRPAIAGPVHRSRRVEPLGNQVGRAFAAAGVEARRIGRLVAPGVFAALGAAARGVLPFLLGGQALARPGAEGRGLVEVDAIDGVVLPSLGVAPVAGRVEVTTIVAIRLRRAALAGAHAQPRSRPP